MDAEMMGSAIRDFYTGKSYKQIAEGLKEEYDLGLGRPRFLGRPPLVN